MSAVLNGAASTLSARRASGAGICRCSSCVSRAAVHSQCVSMRREAAYQVPADQAKVAKFHVGHALCLHSLLKKKSPVMPKASRSRLRQKSLCLHDPSNIDGRWLLLFRRKVYGQPIVEEGAAMGAVSC
eukprot:6189936-Pleurochrysis_carterae.AAC.2